MIKEEQKVKRQLFFLLLDTLMRDMFPVTLRKVLMGTSSYNSYYHVDWESKK